jgi:hypothetical protein
MYCPILRTVMMKRIKLLPALIIDTGCRASAGESSEGKICDGYLGNFCF